MKPVWFLVIFPNKHNTQHTHTHTHTHMGYLPAKKIKNKESSGKRQWQKENKIGQLVACFLQNYQKVKDK